MRKKKHKKYAERHVIPVKKKNNIPKCAVSFEFFINKANYYLHVNQCFFEILLQNESPE